MELVTVEEVGLSSSWPEGSIKECVTGGLGGAVHCATPSASKAERQSDTICVVDCGMVLLGTACFYLLPSLFVDHILSSRNTCRCAMCVWSYQDTE